VRPEFAELAGHDAYDLLGLGPEASGKEIQRAYRTLAKTNHPDRFPEPRAKAEAEETIRLLNAARDVLTGRRAAYDDFRRTRDEEVVEEEIVEDDPCATAEPGAPPADPWDSADDFEPPVPPRPWPPPPPPPPPPNGPPPGVPPFLPHPGRRRPRSLGARLGMGCAFVWLGLVVLYVGLSDLSDYLRARSGPHPSAAVPERFAGTWEGTFGGHGKSHTGGWKAELTLREGKHNGEVRYLGGRCAGTAVPVSADADELTVRTVFPEREAGCDVGRIQLTEGEHGRLKAKFVKDGTVTGTGSLGPR
jgi:curved DNA-binding protein CbpA